MRIQFLMPYRAWLRRLIGFLPESYRFNQYRKMVKFNFPNPELEFRVARTQGELEAAFKILHDAYVDAGFMYTQPSGMRVTIYHALPSTSTLIALSRGRVVGTVSIIRDSALGFPLDAIFDTAQLRKDGARLGEVSSLAIDRQFRGNRGEILFPLLAFLAQYCMTYFGIDYLVIAVNPSRIDFYKAVLFFKDLAEKPVGHYDFVNGAPAVGACMQLRTFYQEMAVHYGKNAPDRNLFKLSMGEPLPNFTFPPRSYHTVSDPVMTPAMLDYFFNKKTDLFSQTNDRDRTILQSLYRAPEYQEVLPKPESMVYLGYSRRSIRFDSECSGRIIVPNAARIVPMKIIDVSNTGFRAIVTEALRYGESLNFNIVIGTFEIADLKGHVVWNRDRVYGFNVTAKSPNWTAFIEYLTSLQHQKESNASAVG